MPRLVISQSRSEPTMKCHLGCKVTRDNKILLQSNTRDTSTVQHACRGSGTDCETTIIVHSRTVSHSVCLSRNNFAFVTKYYVGKRVSVPRDVDALSQYRARLAAPWPGPLRRNAPYIYLYSYFCNVSRSMATAIATGLRRRLSNESTKEMDPMASSHSSAFTASALELGNFTFYGDFHLLLNWWNIKITHVVKRS